MNTCKKMAFVIMILFLLLPNFQAMPQFLSNDPTQTEEEMTVDQQADKTKDKKKSKKDKIQINEKFFILLGMNLAAVLLIISLIYYPNNRKMDYTFTFIIFNVVIFLLTFVLNKIKISIGAAFGLFAVFSMLRYRTAGISMKDMTYLFIFIAIGLISAIQLEYIELAVICGVIIVITFVLDANLIIKLESSKDIRYENIEMIKPENHEKLLNDLRNRTGLNIHRFSINRINFLRDSATIRVYYYEKKS